MKPLQEKKNYASSKKLLTSIKEKGPLGKKSPFTRTSAIKVIEEQYFFLRKEIKKNCVGSETTPY